MSIERDSNIVFDPDGTLWATTNWLSKHDEGLAELLKNALFAYNPKRANVSSRHCAAAILLVDGNESAPARIGVLDVGGATLEDVDRWSVWQDQRASRIDVATQGNGGKAYLFRMFEGQGRLLGVKDGKRNCKGFEGAPNSAERGTPGFVPNAAVGREAPISSVMAELDEILLPYNLRHTDLPDNLLSAIKERQAFTISEGIEPRDLRRKRIQAEELIQSTLIHEQAAVTVELLHIYAFHNGTPLNNGKRLEPDNIIPFPGFEKSRIFEIPAEIPDKDGALVSTIDNQKPRGRLILQTSKDDMDRNWKTLRPRWKIKYGTSPEHTIGSKSISELIPTTPGRVYVYATVELPAFDPDYVVVGRVRPNDGPLMRAVDRFAAEKLRDLANEIHATRRHQLDQKELEAVQRENQKLDHWKNQFLPNGNRHGEGGNAGDGPGGKGPPSPPPPPKDYGITPARIDIRHASEILRVGRGAVLPLEWFLRPSVQDSENLPIRNPELIWISDNARIADFPNPKEGVLVAKAKGNCSIRVKVNRAEVESAPVTIAVCVVDHVLLTPRTLEIPVGKQEDIVAEVTTDEGQRFTDVLLNWEHDADDPMLVRIRPTGTVIGSRLGQTTISAGAGDRAAGGVWARVRAEVNIVANPNIDRSGGGFPTLKITDRDKDPETGEVRESDPDAPPLWQDVPDFKNNIWWLNLGSKEVASAYNNQKTGTPQAWRLYHAQKVVEMVVLVHMRQEFTAKREGEIPGLWSDHWETYNNLQKQYIPLMWEKLNQYVLTGTGLD